MIIPIVGSSAVEFWLGPSSAIFTNYAFNMKKSLVSIPEDFDFLVTADVARYAAKQLDLKLPLQNFSFSHTHHQCGKAAHVLTRYKSFPENSFVKFGLGIHDVYVARPELCFIQVGRSMDLPNHVHLGIKLTAQYYLQKETKAELGRRAFNNFEQKPRAPVATEESLREYLKIATGEYGVKKARAAARYVVELSNSPMESAIATMTIVPFDYGGYGMRRFSMNEEVGLSESAAQYYGYDRLRGDFLWKNQKLILEYNSNQYHNNDKQHSEDTNRINAFQKSGYRVVPITYKNISTFGEMENLMSYLMDELGCPELKFQLESNQDKRRKLWETLIARKS